MKTVRTQQADKRQSSEKLTHSNEMKLEAIDQVAQRQARFDKLNNAYKEQREVCPLYIYIAVTSVIITAMALLQLMNKELLETYSKVEDLELEVAQLQNSQTNALANSEKELTQLDQQ